MINLFEKQSGGAQLVCRCEGKKIKYFGQDAYYHDRMASLKAQLS